MPNQAEPCVCGRSYIHCKGCGRRSPYYKRYRSLDLSVERGKEISVYRCQCGLEFTNEDVCKAPKVAISTEIALIPGTVEHFEALTEAARKHAESKGVSLSRGYVAMIKKGWDVSKYELDEEVKGILSGDEEFAQQGNKEQEAPMRGAQQDKAPLLPQEPVALDDIIKAMQEEQK